VINSPMAGAKVKPWPENPAATVIGPRRLITKLWSGVVVYRHVFALVVAGSTPGSHRAAYVRSRAIPAGSGR
jgi:hypothetical protein